MPEGTKQLIARYQPGGAGPRMNFTFTKPDHAGQMQITVDPVGIRGAPEFTWSIVGNSFEQTTCYLTFAERLALTERSQLQSGAGWGAG